MTTGNIQNSGGTAALQGSFSASNEDSYTRNLSQQIANAQKKLQDLSADSEMTLEEKIKKRQEIRQEITGLQQQIRQHEIEVRRERQAKKTADGVSGANRTRTVSRGEKRGAGFSAGSMKAILAADSSMKLAQTQGSAATQMEGKAGVLEAEIQADKGRGASTEKKEAELADLTERIGETQSAQLSTLSDAVKTLEEAAETDRTAKEETDGAADGGAKTETAGETAEAENAANAGQRETSVATAQPIEQTGAAKTGEAQTVNHHVDVKL